MYKSIFWVSFPICFLFYSCLSDSHALCCLAIPAAFRLLFANMKNFIFFRFLSMHKALTHLDQYFIVLLWTLNRTHIHTECHNTCNFVRTDTLGSVRLSLLVCHVYLWIYCLLAAFHIRSHKHTRELLSQAFAFLFHFVSVVFAMPRARAREDAANLTDLSFCVCTCRIKMYVKSLYYCLPPWT